MVLTSLREESAESMVIVGGFALLREVSIRLNLMSALMRPGSIAVEESYLDAVLEAVELWCLN